MFAANMRKALKNLNGEKELSFEVEMEAFELLMREDIDWPGNIRQLEAVTRTLLPKHMKSIKMRIPPMKLK